MTLQIGNRLGLAAGDGVQVVLHAGGEAHVDEIREVVLQQVHHRDRPGLVQPDF